MDKQKQCSPKSNLIAKKNDYQVWQNIQLNEQSLEIDNPVPGFRSIIDNLYKSKKSQHHNSFPISIAKGYKYAGVFRFKSVILCTEHKS